jgi:hypothetical protein
MNAGVRWIAELLIEALFDNLQNAADYRKLAKVSADANVRRIAEIKVLSMKHRYLLQQGLWIHTSGDI